MEMPGCSLCMGNQARVADGATVVSTSTRNFPNRLGKGANVYLSSAELAAVCALLGKILTFEEYMSYMGEIGAKAPRSPLSELRPGAGISRSGGQGEAGGVSTYGPLASDQYQSP